MSKKFSYISSILFIAFLIVIGPLLTLWTLNTLFPSLAIPYTFWTWLAAGVANTALYAKSKQ